jgi:integrase
MVEEAAALAVAAPAPEHGLGVWFKPIVAQRLKDAGITTLGELVAFCNRRGGSWWRGVPRIGAGRARHIVAWLRQHEPVLGLRVDVDVDETDPLRADDAQIVEIGGRYAGVIPLERMAVAHPLSGAEGANRAPTFPYIAAHNDLDAIRAYLHHYRDRPKTLRAYTKELERFLLWCVCERRKALSDLLVDDCEAYKDFLKAPSPAFVGPRFARTSPRWRPFADGTLLPESQRYAVRALRAAFAWLVDVRYLAGNPWKAVGDPPVVRRQGPMQIERALPASLGERVRAFVDQQCADTTARRWRAARAALLLMNDSGLRREEAAGARREKLHETTIRSADGEPLPIWELTVIGKRNAERTVPVSPETIEALRAHWADRKEPFDAANAIGPLLSPIFIPRTSRALAKHAADDAQPYSVKAINELVRWSMRKAIAGMDGLSPAEIARLQDTSPHAFRHAFGTQAADANVPLHVIQRILGHRSLQTTTIYVQTEKQRMMREAAGFYAARRQAGGDDDADIGQSEAGSQAS